jgi:hypothetical protein
VWRITYYDSEYAYWSKDFEFLDECSTIIFPEPEVRVPVRLDVLTAVAMKTVGCDAVHSGRISLMFVRNVLPPSTGSKIKPSKQKARSNSLTTWPPI